MLARIPLVPVLLLASFLALIATILTLVGVPMAGAGSALAAVVVAALLTIPMALAFAHGARGDSSGH
jgi:hypothetical protein